MSACAECGRNTTRRLCHRCYSRHRQLIDAIPRHTAQEPIAPSADDYLNEKVLARCLFCGALIDWPRWRLGKDDVTCTRCF